MDKERIEKAVREILAGIGEDPNRQGLLETPARVARMYEEILGGANGKSNSRALGRPHARRDCAFEPLTVQG